MSIARGILLTNPHLFNPHLPFESFNLEGTNNIGVLLVHGFTATTAEVRLLAEFLNEKGFTVHAPLLPGHATTPVELNHTNRQAWIDAVEGAYKTLRQEVEMVFVGGESMGAVLSLNLAASYPEIAGILTFAPAIAVPLTRFERIMGRLYANVRMSLPKGSIDVPDKWQGYPDNPLLAANQLFKLQDDTRKLLSKINQPVLIVQGRLDTAISPESGAIIMEGVSSKDASLFWMEESTHVVLLDKEWEQIAEIALAFIQRIAAETVPA